MPSLFHPADRHAIARRLACLEPTTPRLWGRMNPAQMLAHCALGFRSRGAEQAWFTANLANAPTVIGTEISDTAAQFPATVQWDFHDINPEWTGKADFVYSNSWDHAFDPQRAFAAWIDALRPGGLLLLDHTKDQSPETTNALDPFGATIEKLQSMFQDLAESGALLPTLDTRQTNPEYRARVVVFEKAK